MLCVGYSFLSLAKINPFVSLADLQRGAIKQEKGDREELFLFAVVLFLSSQEKYSQIL